MAIQSPSPTAHKGYSPRKQEVESEERGQEREEKGWGESKRQRRETRSFPSPHTGSHQGRLACVFPGGFSLFLHMFKLLCISFLAHPSVLGFSL